MCSVQFAVALIALTALASGAPELQRIRIRGDAPAEGGLKGILPGEGEGAEETGELGTVGGSLLGGGNLDVLENLLGVLGPNPVGLGLLGNATNIPPFLSDFLESIPEDVLGQVTDLLENKNLPISDIISQLNEIIPGNLVQDLLNTVTRLVSQLLDAIARVLSNLPSVLDQVTAVVNKKDQTVEQQTQAIDELKRQFPVEVDTIFFIASQLAKTLQEGPVPSVSETPQVPV